MAASLQYVPSFMTPGATTLAGGVPYGIRVLSDHGKTGIRSAYMAGIARKGV